MRRVNDFYPTPSNATKALLKRIPFTNRQTVIEPCAGKHAITKELGFRYTYTCDIDPLMEVNLVADMSQVQGWQKAQKTFGHPFEWVITNPPFNCAIDFAQHGWEYCTVGMALLLRLSFLEPTEKRQQWLMKNPPHQLIVLPRISFTEDGKTDSVTCAWMVWYKNTAQVDCQCGIEIVGKDELRSV